MGKCRRELATSQIGCMQSILLGTMHSSDDGNVVASVIVDLCVAWQNLM